MNTAVKRLVWHGSANGRRETVRAVWNVGGAAAAGWQIGPPLAVIQSLLSWVVIRKGGVDFYILVAGLRFQATRGVAASLSVTSGACA
jgi:hypothetical protein